MKHGQLRVSLRIDVEILERLAFREIVCNLTDDVSFRESKAISESGG